MRSVGSFSRQWLLSDSKREGVTLLGPDITLKPFLHLRRELDFYLF